MNGILHREKTVRERILKNISICELHYFRYHFIKVMYKVITSLFLQKSLEADRNLEIQPK